MRTITNINKTPKTGFTTSYLSGTIATINVNISGSGYIVNDQINITGGNNDAIFYVKSINGTGGVIELWLRTYGYNGYLGSNYTNGNYSTTGGSGDGLLTVDITTLSGQDDGDLQYGNPLTPRFIDNGDNTITDRLANLMWIKNPILIIPDGLNSNNIGVFKNTWTIATPYSKGDVVGSPDYYTPAYICLVNHNSVNPTNFTNSTPYTVGDYICDNNTIPSYADATPYAIGDCVLDDTDTGNYYRCITVHTSSGSSVAIDGGGSNWLTNINSQLVQGSTGWFYKCIVNHTSAGTDVQADGSDTNWLLIGTTPWQVELLDNPTWWLESVFSSGDGVNLLSMHWNEALVNCNQLIKSGYTDWRLPNINELKSLVNLSISLTLDTTYFTLNYNVEYWSSSAFTQGGNNWAYTMTVNYGYVGYDTMTVNNGYVGYENITTNNGYVLPCRNL